MVVAMLVGLAAAPAIAAPTSCPEVTVSPALSGTVGSAISVVVNRPDGAWDNLAHDDIDHELTGLADHTLGAGESADFLLAFSGGAGDGSGGHDLWVDNVALSGSFVPAPEPPVLEHGVSGGDLVFTWNGDGFVLQLSTNLMEGTWEDYPGGGTPPITVDPAEPAAFFRLIEE